MSGSSTLRICLAAMAPALSEAASAGLKLQDTVTNETSVTKSTIDPQNGNQNSITFQQSRQKPFLIGSSNALGGHTELQKERRVSYLSFPAVEEHRNRTNGQVVPLRSSPTSNCPSKLHVSASLSFQAKNISDLHLKPFNLKESSKKIDIYNISVSAEDFQLSPVKKERDNIIDNFKNMSQQQIAAENRLESSRVVESGDTGITLNERSEIITPVMVNGEDELKQKNNKVINKESCDEKEEITLKKAQILEGLASNFSFKDKALTSKDKMGVYIKDDKVGPHVAECSKLEGVNQTEDRLNEEMRKDCAKKQVHLEKKVDVLLRRLKRMKGKVVESHTKEQLRQFVNYQHKTLQMVAKTIKKETPGPEELKEHFLSNEEVKNMSTAQLVKLVKTYQATKPVLHSTNGGVRMATANNSSAVIMDPIVQDQALKTSERLGLRIQTARAELDSDATASSSGGESGDEEGVNPKLQPDITLPPLLKRAEWKWAVDRAAVVAKWTWLQAQVSDLEYRIRQQSQVYRQLRNSKGGVVLGDPPTAADILRRLHGLPQKTGVCSNSDGKVGAVEDSSSPGNEVSPCNVSAVMSNIDKQASRLTQSLGNCLSPTNSGLGSPQAGSKLTSPQVTPLQVNGCTDSPTSSTCTEAETTTAENSPMVPTELRLTEKFGDLLSQQQHSSHIDATCQAARCRPLRSYRKRKILRTIGLYKTSLKAARLSDVRCRCYPPGNPCPMCGGRYNNTQTIDPDGSSFGERVALLDPSFHPVLSFPQDVHLPIHCEGLLKSGMWQNKPPPRRSRINDYRRQKVIALVTEPTVRKASSAKQNGRNNSAASVINFSTKIKNKYDSKTKGKKAPTPKGTSLKPKGNKVKRKAAKLARESFKKSQLEEYDEDLEALYLGQEVNAVMTAGRDPLMGSSSQSALKELRDGHMSVQRKRKVDHSFDINNIVIPLSMAALTRVEQPQYKEIVTPKWREVMGGVKGSESAVDGEALVKVSENVADNGTLITKRLEKTNGMCQAPDQHKHQLTTDHDQGEEEDEDLSDEKFAQRHSEQEKEEKKRFRNFVQYPPVRRNRARSEMVFGSLVDKTDGEFASKALAEGVDGSGMSGVLSSIQEGEPSRPATPMLSRSLTSLPPATPEELTDTQQLQLFHQRRRTSLTRRERCSAFEDLHHSLLDCGGIEPWPRRTFPLSEEDFKLMLEDAPANCEPVHQRVTRRLAEPSGKVYVGSSVDLADDTISAAPSPHPSNDSISSAGDDPNDPEWAGGGEPSLHKRIRHRRAKDDPSDPEWNGTDTMKKGKKR